MTNKKILHKGFALIILLLLPAALIAVAIGYITYRNKTIRTIGGDSVPSENTISTKNPGKEISATPTESNPDIPFTVKYPAKYIKSTSSDITENPNYLLSIESAKNFPNTVLHTWNTFQVITIPAATTEAKCYIKSSDNTPLTLKKNLNGVTVYYSKPYGGAASGTHNLTEEYKTFRGGTCYFINLTHWESSDWNSPDDVILAKKDSDESFIELHQILSTFIFTDKEKIKALDVYKNGQLTDWEKEALKDVYWPILKPFKTGDAKREVYLVGCDVTQTGFSADAITTEVSNISNIAETTLRKLVENGYGGFPSETDIKAYEKTSGLRFKNPRSGINGIKLNNGVITVNFYDSVAAYGGGSSRVGCMALAVGLTAKQFPSITSVKMCIDKYERCDYDFQP